MSLQKESPESSVFKTMMLLEFWVHRARFLGRINRRIFNRGMAEDIFQEACVKFLSANAVFPYPQAATGYFWKIIDSLIVNFVLGNRRLQFLENPPERVSEAGLGWYHRMLLEEVMAAVGRLPAKDQQLLATCFFNPDQVRLKDKCGALGLSSGNMRYRLGLVLSKLNRTLAVHS